MRAEGAIVLAGGVFLGVIAIRGTWRQIFPFLVSAPQTQTPTPPAPPIPGGDVSKQAPSTNPTNGKCPAGYYGPASDGLCHKQSHTPKGW